MWSARGHQAITVKPLCLFPAVQVLGCSFPILAHESSFPSSFASGGSKYKTNWCFLEWEKKNRKGFQTVTFLFYFIPRKNLIFTQILDLYIYFYVLEFYVNTFYVV